LIVFQAHFKIGISLSLLLAQRIFMQPKKENYWFMFRMLLLLNVALITAIVLVRPGKASGTKHTEPCTSAKKVNAEVLNAITIKLM
jgi:hypothetical protein